MKISVIIPVFNEEANLDNLVKEIGSDLSAYKDNFEIIIIDDHSNDKTAVRLKNLSAQYAWVKGIYFARNYGQSTALQAGFDRAVGQYVVTMDGDLQNDPADIPRLVEYLERFPEVDCVSGWRKDRQDDMISRKIPSMLANKLISFITNVKLHDYGCALKAYRFEIIASLRLYGELHRFIPALAKEVGATIVEMPVNHRARTAGVSKYGIDRIFRVLLDLFWIKFTMRFLHRPIHAFGGVGMSMFVLGTGILSYLSVDKLVFNNDIGNRPLFILGVLFILIGIQLLATGLIGEVLIRIYHEPQGRKQYIEKYELPK